MRKFIAILVVLILLLCSCRATKVVERVDTVRVERVTEASHGRFEAAVVHDTTAVEITRYDTLERVTERIVVQRGKVATKWAHDTLTVRDTVTVAASSQQHVTEERVAVAEPVTWRRWAAAAVLGLLVLALLWWARCKGSEWTDKR